MSIKIEINEKELFKDALAGDYKSAYRALVDAERELDSLRFRLMREALDGRLPAENLGDQYYSSLFHKTGDHNLSWDCPTSPIGTCVYDSYQDRAWDNCLFCHDPFERK